MVWTMRKTIGQWARRVAPAVMAERAVRHERNLRGDRDARQLAEAFVADHGDGVLGGPVRGLRYTSTGDAAVAKLLGAYELEIGAWMEEGLAACPATFIDVGAADGYYAVGAKVRCPDTRVVAFELSATARGELASLAALNNAEIDIRRGATSKRIANLRLRDALVLCDGEGSEADILLPDALRACTIIVELHEHLRAGVTEQLRDRFAPTHRAEIARSVPRDASQYPELQTLPEALRVAALDEHRPSMQWARFTPR